VDELGEKEDKEEDEDKELGEDMTNLSKLRENTSLE